MLLLTSTFRLSKNSFFELSSKFTFLSEFSVNFLSYLSFSNIFSVSFISSKSSFSNQRSKSNFIFLKSAEPDKLAFKNSPIAIFVFGITTFAVSRLKGNVILSMFA